MILNCLVCNKEFKGFPCRIKEGKEKYCSRKCSYIAKIGKPIGKGRKFTKEHIENLKKANSDRSYMRTKAYKEMMSKIKKGKFTRENASQWKGGKYALRGYIQILNPSHPFSNKKGYIAEHRLIMEQHIGRYLKQKEEIHHINGIKDDNRIENLKLCKNKSEHMKYHRGFSGRLFSLSNNC